MKSLLFKEALFNQILTGNKTQTRRLVKTSYPYDELRLHDFDKNAGLAWSRHKSGRYLEHKSRLKVGDICYLKEPYLVWHDKPIYKFDNPNLDDEIKEVTEGKSIWENKLFMPEKYARYFIKITNVGIQELQHISPEDAIKEGIEQVDRPVIPTEKVYKIYLHDGVTNVPRLSFRSLWESIHQSENRWVDNPFVWVYEFEMIDKKEVYES